MALVVILAVTGEQLWLSRSRIIDNATVQISRLGMVFAEQTSRSVETVDLLLRNMTELTPDLVKENANQANELLRRRMAGLRQVSALAVSDAEGTVVASSSPDLMGRLPPAGMAALASGREDGTQGVRISQPYRDQNDRWAVMMTRRLQPSDGRFAGIAIALLNLSYFEDFYEAVDLAENGSILLHLRNGTVLARYPRLEGVVGASYANQLPFMQVLAHARAGTVVMKSPVDGSERIVAIRALKSLPLAISVSVGVREVLSSWRQEVWVFSAAALFGGVGLVGMLLYLSRQARDAAVAERLRTLQELARVGSLDALTGLLNRTTLTQRLERLLDRAETGRHQVALLFLDLDGFKQINDVQGHRAGDAVLRLVAQRIAGAAAPADVARWGGDEFVIIALAGVPQTAPDAAGLAASVLREVLRPIVVDGQTVRLGGTVGIATYPQDGRTPDALVSAADAAMYDGKQAGGNVVRVFDPALAQAVAASAQLERDLRLALHDEALTLAYQPIVEMPGERCVAFEALVRWDHPARGSVPPDEFIPVAEHSGLIGRLGQWVLARACQDAAGWPPEAGIAVTVNVSLAQVFSGDLLQDVSAALARSGLPAHRLRLELTESMAGADHQRVIPVLRQLRGLGVGIALDDFGTGFSSLSRLRTWPIDTVKIDKAFVQAMDRDGTAVIRATLLVAREYGLNVTVEGVETVEQWRELAALGVQSFQGFLFSHPLSGAMVLPWLVRVSEPAVPRTRRLGWGRLEHSPLIERASPFAGD